MKWLRRAIVLLIVGGIVAAVAWSFVPRPILVDTAEVQRGPFESTVDADGVTRVKDRHVVSAPVTATLRRIELHPGDRVTAGGVVARLAAIEPPLADAQARTQAAARLRAAQAGLRQARAAVERARVARDLAERELARSSELLRRGVVGAGAVDVAESDLRTRARDFDSARFGAGVAENEVELTEAALSRIQHPPGPEEVLELRSPVEGVVLRVLRESEGVVAPGSPLLELADPAALEIVVDVPTAEAIAVRPGAPVALERWGGDRPLAGHVRLVEPAAFTKISALGVEEQRVNVIIDLDEPAALGDGYRVEARIAIWRGESVVQVPASALFRDGSNWAVFLWSNDRALLRRVEVGRRSGLRAQVTVGLESGEVVIIHPGDAVGDGVRVARR